MTRSRIILLSLIGALLLAGAVYALVELSNEDVAPSEEVVTEQQEPEQDNSPENQTETEADTTKEDMPQKEDTDKTSIPAATVNSKPVAYTAYGHTSEKPVRQGQSTSTTCTTDANVECRITFTNTSTGEIVEFDAKETDNQGVAIWQWTGGEDVPNGTWEIQAKAGDKQSTKEVIYVE